MSAPYRRRLRRAWHTALHLYVSGRRDGRRVLHRAHRRCHKDGGR